MTTTQILLGVAALYLLSKRAGAAQARRAQLNDPTNWGADQWARIYGADLANAGVVHDTQTSLTAYGFEGCLGFRAGA